MKTTVLLIDDSKFQRRANELAVSRSGYSVLIAEDGDQGLQMARDNVPDVIVLDMMLPKLSGPELLHALKDDARTARIPIIVLSSLPQSNEARLLSEGAAAYLEKAKLGIESGSAALIQSIASVLGQPSRQF